MSKYEVKMVFTAYIQIEAESENEAIENAMEKAFKDYGSEVYEYANFTMAEKESV